MASQQHDGQAERLLCQPEGEIELQVKLWRRNNGTYPAANLSNIGANTTYFPQRPAHLPGRRHRLHNQYNHWTALLATPTRLQRAAENSSQFALPANLL